MKVCLSAPGPKWQNWSGRWNYSRGSRQQPPAQHDPAHTSGKCCTLPQNCFHFFCFFVKGGGLRAEFTRKTHVKAWISFIEFTTYFKTLVREKFTPQLSLHSSHLHTFFSHILNKLQWWTQRAIDQSTWKGKQRLKASHKIWSAPSLAQCATHTDGPPAAALLHPTDTDGCASVCLLCWNHVVLVGFKGTTGRTLFFGYGITVACLPAGRLATSSVNDIIRKHFRNKVALIECCLSLYRFLAIRESLEVIRCFWPCSLPHRLSVQFENACLPVD